MDENNVVESRLNHRFDLIEDIDRELEEKYNLVDADIEKHQNSFKIEIKELKEEVENLSEQVDKLVRVIYNVGHVLKGKLNKKEFEDFKELVESLKLEEVMHRSELENSFAKYS